MLRKLDASRWDDDETVQDGVKNSRGIQRVERWLTYALDDRASRKASEFKVLQLEPHVSFILMSSYLPISLHGASRIHLTQTTLAPWSRHQSSASANCQRQR